MAERKELQLQGPRPSALKITKDSHKIRKPPLPAPPIRPVIIYTVSPKTIHTDPSKFKDLVQRLTGCHRPSSSSDGLNHHQVQPEMMSMSMPMPMPMSSDIEQGVLERIGHFPVGILSPTPGLLPPISPNIFTPPPPPAAEAVDLRPLTHFFQDLSPIAPNFSSSLDFFHNYFPDFH